MVDSETMQAIVERYMQGGTTQRELAIEFGLTPKIVWRVLKNNHVKTPRSTYRHQVDVLQLYDLYFNKRLSTVQISELLNIPRETINYNLRKDGYTPLTRKEAQRRISKERMDQRIQKLARLNHKSGSSDVSAEYVFRLHRQGKCLEDIATQTGWSRWKLARMLRESGFPMRERSAGRYHHHGFYSSTKTASEHYFASSYEYRAFIRLDAEREVVWWSKNWKTVIYYDDSNGTRRKYYPDIVYFTASAEEHIVEVKPESMRHYGNNVAKEEAARQFCSERGIVFEIWTEEDLPYVNSVPSLRNGAGRSND